MFSLGMITIKPDPPTANTQIESLFKTPLKQGRLKSFFAGWLVPGDGVLDPDAYGGASGTRDPLCARLRSRIVNLIQGNFSLKCVDSSYYSVTYRAREVGKLLPSSCGTPDALLLQVLRVESEL